MFERVPEKSPTIAGIGEARRYLEEHRGLTAFYRPVLDEISRRPTVRTVLDVGCGPGILAVAVARECPDVHVVGIDTSEAMTRVARVYAVESGVADRVEFCVGAGEDDSLVTALGVFDAVVTTNSLHHFPEPERVLRNLWHACAPGGTLIVSDLTRAWWLYMIPGKGGFLRSVRAAYTRREMDEMLGRSRIWSYSYERRFPWIGHAIIARRPVERVTAWAQC